MRLHRVQSMERVASPLDEVWEFFSDPRNLAAITPPWLRFRLTSDPPPRMHPGLIITYRIAPFPGVHLPWITEITHVVEKELFVDEQRGGPYRFWHHQHHFRAIEGGTEMRDIVHYALPLGIVGDVVAGASVRRRVRAIFAYRRNVLRERFPVLGADAPGSIGLA